MLSFNFKFNKLDFANSYSTAVFETF